MEMSSEWQRCVNFHAKYCDGVLMRERLSLVLDDRNGAEDLQEICMAFETHLAPLTP